MRCGMIFFIQKNLFFQLRVDFMGHELVIFLSMFVVTVVMYLMIINYVIRYFL
jgi:hypothetical protein